MGSLDGTIQGYRAADGSVAVTIHAPTTVASSLVVDGNLLMFGGGVPKEFGGSPQGMGVFACLPSSTPSPGAS